MAGLIYFGTKDKQSWIKAPLSGMSASSNGWSSDSMLLNGRMFSRSSYSSSRKFEPSWNGDYNATDEASLQHIIDYANGLYGDGPYYFLDPFSTNQNVMPPNWAAPMLAEKDWDTLSEDITPTFTKSVINNHFPTKYATYVTTNNFVSQDKLTIIIPAGYKFHFGWHGPATGSTTGIRIVPYLRSTGEADTALNPVKLTAGGTVRTNTQINGTTYSRVEIFLATTSASTVNITAMMGQVLPDGTSVASGGFISGKGTTGIAFSSKPNIQYYSASIGQGQIGMSASWIEV